MRKALGFMTVALLVAAPLTAQESFQLSGDRVAIYNLAGEVEVVRGSGSDVVVEVTRGGSDAARLTIETGSVDGREALRVIYPSDEVIYSRGGNGRWSSTVRVQDDGTFGGRGGERVRIRGAGSGLEAHADLRIEVPAGSDVAVFLAVGEALAEGVSADLVLDLGSGTVTAREIVGALRIDTGSGSVELADVTGEVEVDTGSGSVSLNGVSGPSLMVDTGSGSISGSGIEADRVHMDTGSGRIELAAVAASDLEMDTGSGSVVLEMLTTVERLIVDTGSGGVTVTLPGSLDADIEVDTGSGGIDIDFEMDVRVMERDHVEGRVGNGSGVIRIDTGSGGVRILRR